VLEVRSEGRPSCSSVLQALIYLQLLKNPATAMVAGFFLFLSISEKPQILSAFDRYRMGDK